MRAMTESTTPVLTGGAESPGGDLARNRALRESALSETRRNLIMDAARAAFLELGLDRASLREIAKRAGYSPGAIYTYFSSLEAIYGALLEESLQRLQEAVVTAEGQAPSDAPSEKVRATGLAFYAYYRDNPKDLDLGFYLFNGARPRGLTPELNRRLNDQLMKALEPVRRGLEEIGHAPAQAVSETTAIFAHIVGTLMLANTGRIRLFRQDPDALDNRYLDSLLK